LLFLIINQTYSNFHGDSDEKFEIWFNLLKNTPFDLAQHNLRNHIMTEKFAPTVADIVNRAESQGPHVPGANETYKMLAQRESQWANAVPMPAAVKERLKLIAGK